MDKDLFSSLPDDDVICFKVGGFCGMVAYRFTRWFVEKVLIAIEQNNDSFQPLDHLVDSVQMKELGGLNEVRIQKAYHIGIVSSNGHVHRPTADERITKPISCNPYLVTVERRLTRAGSFFAV